MLTPGMLDILTQFIAEYSPEEVHADILEALSDIPPLPTLQRWLLELELSCRLEGLHHTDTAGQLAGYIEALRKAKMEQSPYVCRAHLDLALSELEVYRLLKKCLSVVDMAPHGSPPHHRLN